MNYKNTILILLIAVLTILLLLLSSHRVSSDDNSCINNTLFYMFGESTCPHCKSQYDFFSQNYQVNSYYFCIIDKYTDCYNKFLQFVSEELISNAGVNRREIGVPLTIVIRKYGDYESIAAVVIGAIIDKNFWQMLACAQPSSNIPVYIGTRQAYWISVNVTNHRDLLEKYIAFPYSVTTTDKNSSIDSVFLTTLVIVVLTITAIGGYILYNFSKK